MSITRAELLTAARTARALGYSLTYSLYSSSSYGMQQGILECFSPHKARVLYWSAEVSRIKALMADETQTLGCWQVRRHMRDFYDINQPTWVWPYWAYMDPRTKLEGCHVIITPTRSAAL